MKYFTLRLGLIKGLTRGLTVALIAASLCFGIAAAATAASLKGLMYIGTLDRKLLIINENSGDIVGEISLGGIPRTTVLSADKTKLHVVTTQMQVETVDLAARQVISSFPLSDGKSNPRMTRGAGGRGFSGRNSSRLTCRKKRSVSRYRSRRATTRDSVLPPRTRSRRMASCCMFSMTTLLCLNWQR
jgi:hypothetical protein